MMQFTLPITHIVLNPPDARTLVRSTKGTNGLKKNKWYQLVAVNAAGRVAVSSPDDLENLVQGPTGEKWHQMSIFEWVPSTTPPDVAAAIAANKAANDNAE